MSMHFVVVQVHIHVFLCPDMCFVWLVSRAVKAERSEFILSLDGPTSQPKQGSPDEGRLGYSPFASFRLPSILSPPFHPHSDVSISLLGASWVFSIQSVLPSVSATSPSIGRMEGGPGQ
jgi:hypothetical protein